MAFVVNSKRTTVIEQAQIESNAELGPGTYDVEGQVHKDVMGMLYPRKTVPFNTNEYRHGIDHVIPEETPGKLLSIVS